MTANGGEEPTARPGSGADLSRRMDRIEQRQDSIEQEMHSLATTVGRVEQNQAHATELNKLRFDALDAGIRGNTARLDAFIARIEGIITGEIDTQQGRQGRELIADYQRWRDTVDERLAIIYTPEQRALIERRLDEHDRFVTQGTLLARLGVLIVSTNVLGLAVAIYAAIKP
jgi:hypothetical protein